MSGKEPTAGSEPAGPMAELQRLDWRFLLESPELVRVGYVGAANDGLLAALRRFSRALDVLRKDADPAGEETAGGYDVVVACEPTELELSRAAGWVRPGGTLVVEARRSPLDRRSRTEGGSPSGGGPLGPREIARGLPALGLEAVRSYWHWPDFDRCTRIIPLDDPAAIQHALSHSGQGTRHRVSAWLGRRLAGMGLLQKVGASCVSVMGRRAHTAPAWQASSEPHPGNGSGTWHTSLVHRFLNRRWNDWALERRFAAPSPSFVILTPRFRNSTHLVFLLLRRSDSSGVLVAKVSRLRGPAPKLELEASHLKAINAPPHEFDSIPRVVAFAACEDHMMMLQTALPGRGMDRPTVRRRGLACCESVLAWLIEVHRATRVESEATADWFPRLVGGPLDELRALFPSETRLLERTRRLVAPLAGMRLPLVLEHADLSHPNLLVDDDGSVAVVDWEQAELRGLPAVDLFFFLTYVGRALGAARSTEEAIRAIDQAFFSPPGWARSYTRRYAVQLGLTWDMLTPLFICCWTRQVAGLARRVGDGHESSGSPDGDLQGWLLRDWRVAAWRHAVEQSERLDWETLE